LGLVLGWSSTAVEDLGFANLSLLLLLGQVAEHAAAGDGNIGDEGTLEVVLAADFRALESFEDPVESEAGGSEEHEALLKRRKVSYWNEQRLKEESLRRC